MNNTAFTTTTITTTATIAAQRAAQQRMAEEEEMTAYSAGELSEGWEFKILRSHWGSFGVPERLQEILAEEARAGWTLVEVFDHQRIRLKRPASARAADGQLDFDAYRTFLREPMPERWKKVWTGFALIVALVAVLAVAVGLLAAVLSWLF
jgi:hypothetical protein